MAFGTWGAVSPHAGISESRLRRELDRLFEEFGGMRGDNSWIPSVDVCEMRNELRIDFELPGIKPEDVEITVENGILSVSGEQQAEDGEGENARYHMTERSHGAFFRSFALPRGIDESEITADFDDGVLHVHIPKDALPRPRQIEIRHGDGDRSPKAIAARSEEPRDITREGSRDVGRSERSDTRSRARGKRAEEPGRETDGNERRPERMAAKGRTRE